MPDSDRVFLAIDLGASSGRVLAGLFSGTRLTLEEVHRFENRPVTAAGRMHWDILGLWQQIKDGLRAASSQYGNRVVSVGVDTWGVDFGLLGRNDELLGNPYHYRDVRTQGVMEEAFASVSREEIFAETGLQFMEFNTLFQLIAMRRSESTLLDAATSFLMMPDLVNWLLTGEKSNEYTDATTTQFCSPQTKDWTTSLLDRFDIPTSMLGTIVPPGTSLGHIRADVARETGVCDVDVVLPGTHDTASAVMAVPAAGQFGGQPNWCYISSGTWSLMGAETPHAIITDRCRELNFTNEGGVGGTNRLLKNIAGLWLIQECRRIWQQSGKSWSWDQLVAAAADATPLTAVINPDHAALIAPSDMPSTIRDLCHQSGQAVPATEGAVIRCALESIALRYRSVLNWLEELIGQRLDTIHIVGGGTQNRLLCQMAADACNRTVIAGPVEATALGNVAVQAIAAGELGSIADARDMVRESSDVERYDPVASNAWDVIFERFMELHVE